MGDTTERLEAGRTMGRLELLLDQVAAAVDQMRDEIERQRREQEQGEGGQSWPKA